MFKIITIYLKEIQHASCEKIFFKENKGKIKKKKFFKNELKKKGPKKRKLSDNKKDKDKQVNKKYQNK